MSATGKVQAILLFLFGIIATYFAYYMITGLVNIAPTTTLKALTWIGAIATWIGVIIITPIIKITKDTANIAQAAKSFLYFAGGWIFAIILHHTIPLLIDFSDNAGLRGIFWIGLLTIQLLAIVGLPIFNLTKALTYS